MSSTSSSSICFTSNIYPVNGSPLTDRHFLSQIHEPKALEFLDRRIKSKMTDYRFSAIQAEEFRHASLHCKYAADDDYPWGTIVIDGEKRICCKCTKFDCSEFSQCRSFGLPFDESELLSLRENGQKVAAAADVVVIRRTVDSRSLKTAVTDAYAPEHFPLSPT